MGLPWLISSVAPYAGTALISGIQPSYLTSDYEMGLYHGLSHLWHLWYGMGLTSAIQPNNLTSDYKIGLANYHGYPSVAPYTEMVLTSAIQPVTSDQVMGLTMASVAPYTSMALPSAI